MQNHDLDHAAETPGANLPTDRRALLAGIGGLAAGAFFASTANAGPLSPPPGPISSTPGPEPRIPINQTNTPGDANNTFRITQSGSYYFPGNLLGQPQRSGILIAASDVTIDMMGYRLQPINVGSGSGIINSGTRVNITIRNGTITKWEGAGIDLSVGTQCSNIRIEGVTVTENLTRGIRAGQNAIVYNCIAQANGGTGIETGLGCVVQSCTSRSNTGTGIFAGQSCAVSHCIAPQNGSLGIFVNSGSSVLACTADQNGTNGIAAGNDCLIQDCTARSNGASGITGAIGNRIMGCVSTNNTQSGILTASGSTVTESNANGNATGINLGPRSTAARSRANSNTGTGIAAATACSVLECSASSNPAYGISLTGRCVARNNTCEDNGTLGQTGTGGMYASDNNNYIHGNWFIRNRNNGIYCVGTENFIFSNMSVLNDFIAFRVPADNFCLAVLAARTLSGIFGLTGGNSPGSDNPWVNFSVG